MNIDHTKQLEIIDYEAQYQPRFRDINYAWIKKYFELSPLDVQAYNYPQKEILDKGGHIFLARLGQEIVGSVSLEKISDKCYVLARMGVDANHQGLKIGQKLLESALLKARQMELESVVLYTNQALVKALNLYVKFGFRFVPLDLTAYNRATIKMELDVLSQDIAIAS